MENKIISSFKYSALSLVLCVFAWGCSTSQQAVQQKQQQETQQQAPQKERYSSLKEALTLSSRLRGYDAPRNLIWIDEGNRYSYMQYDADAKSYQIRSYKPADATDSLLFSTEGLTFPDTGEPFEYSDFQWSNDFNYIIFQSNFRPVYRHSGISDYYLYSLEENELTLLVEDARTAELSPDGEKIGYERGGDLFVYFLDSGEEKQLTDSGKEYFYNGRYGWVYEEEFGLAQAWEWSPDSKYIAFWQTDERDVHLYMLPDYSEHHVQYDPIPYPQVGDINPEVRIGTINVQTGEQQWMDIPLNEGYIPRIYWTANEGQLAIVHLNRPQTHLKLYFSDVTTGESHLVMEEESEYWIDIFDFFAGINHLFFFPDDREEFLWISDRDGWSHIYRYNYDGELINQVTEGEWEVTYVHDVDYDNERIYYSSTEVSPLQRHLYTINFDGTSKVKITQKPGTHNINVSPNAQYYVDSYSSIDSPTQVELHSISGELIKVLDDNADVYEFLEDHAYAEKELFTFTTSDGQQLDGSVIKPIGFDSTKSYPLVLNIYGGPGAQGVYNAFATNGWVQYLAQEGYVIVNVNNRGSGGYGREFEKVVYKQLGKWESHDFVETAEYMAQKSWVDEDRLAIRGHSYGGYMTAYTMTTHPGVFSVGICTAPVTDWRLYDSIYTERYMGLIENNRDGYIQSAVTTHAGNLEGHLLLSHATQDENVHVQNTYQFLTELTSRGIGVDVQIFPPGAHGVAFNTASYLLLYESYVDYLNRWLK
ncbi:MAG TPA: S9 family peptidase [Balneolaceae bacterium]